MRYLKLEGRAPVGVNKAYFTVGVGAGYDYVLSGGSPGVTFAIHREEENYLLIPGEEKIRLNGKSISRPTPLGVCDRIEWRAKSAVFLDDPLNTEINESENVLPKCFEILKGLSANLGSESCVELALEQVLQALVEMAGAEVGYLVSEVQSHSEWEILASVGSAETTTQNEKRRELLSNTILNQAIDSKRAVYVESIVGHPLAGQASIMDASVFSFACLPLLVGTRVYGCVYMYTRTPGKSICRDSLNELSVLATQATLLVGFQGQARAEVATKGQISSATELIFDRENDAHPMIEVSRRIEKLAPSGLSILIRGETGTGKELVAKEIHRKSPMSRGNFVAVNCGAIPSSLMESTLFGYVKGAFTGATKDHRGKFLQAHGGTLFLDEIGDLPLDLQVKLLRVLQEKQVEPVGSHDSIPAEFRVVAATHQNLEDAVREGRFREDLFYRLNGAGILLPPLRERNSDAIHLAKYFLQQLSPEIQLSQPSIKKLKQHEWPGNVRELQQVVRRAAALCIGKEIQPEDLELGSAFAAKQWATQEDEIDLESLKNAQIRFTQSFVKSALEKLDGNRSKAANTLGISERTLYRILSQ